MLNYFTGTYGNICEAHIDLHVIFAYQNELLHLKRPKHLRSLTLWFRNYFFEHCRVMQLRTREAQSMFVNRMDV